MKNKISSLNENELIHQIIYLIKNKEDYKNSAQIMLENLITLENINEKTLKLNQFELAKLADAIIESRK